MADNESKESAGKAAGTDSSGASDFERQAETETPGIVQEFWDFLRFNKKWWLAPIIIVMSLVGVLVLLSGSASAPFIYTLF